MGDGMGWTARLLLILMGVLIVGGAVAGYVGSTRAPKVQAYEQVLPDDRFPH